MKNVLWWHTNSVHPSSNNFSLFRKAPFIIKTMLCKSFTSSSIHAYYNTSHRKVRTSLSTPSSESPTMPDSKAFSSSSTSLILKPRENHISDTTLQWICIVCNHTSELCSVLLWCYGNQVKVILYCPPLYLLFNSADVSVFNFITLIISQFFRNTYVSTYL